MTDGNLERNHRDIFQNRELKSLRIENHVVRDRFGDVSERKTC